NINALSPETRNTLADLKEPVHVYVILRPGEFLYGDIKTFLDNARALTDKLSWEYVPLQIDNKEQITSLATKYKLSDPTGVVVVGPEDKQRHELVKTSDLFRDIPGRRPNEPSGYAFTGEAGIMDAIKQLLDEKKVVIYFTQGAGELPLNPRPGAGGRGENSLG